MRAEAYYQSENKRDDKIHGNAGRGHRYRPPFSIAQIIWIVRHRLGPAKKKWRTDYYQKRRQNNRAEEVDVFYRIQGQTSGIARGIVAKILCHKSVRDFVDDDRHDEYDYIENGIGDSHIVCISAYLMIA